MGGLRNNEFQKNQNPIQVWDISMGAGKTMEVHFLFLGFPSELVDTTLLLKLSHILDILYKEFKLELS